jgi:hypothetical protein
MSARTYAIRSALVQAGDRGLAHLASQQNTGTWIARCGRQVRGQNIHERVGLEAELFAEAHEHDLMCPDCADLAAEVGRLLLAAEARR